MVSQHMPLPSWPFTGDQTVQSNRPSGDECSLLPTSSEAGAETEIIAHQQQHGGQ